jgi:hypothetical protein
MNGQWTFILLSHACFILFIILYWSMFDPHNLFLGTKGPLFLFQYSLHIDVFRHPYRTAEEQDPAVNTANKLRKILKRLGSKSYIRLRASSLTCD